MKARVNLTDDPYSVNVNAPVFLPIESGDTVSEECGTIQCHQINGEKKMFGFVYTTNLNNQCRRVGFMDSDGEERHGQADCGFISFDDGERWIKFQQKQG